jgi:protein TonB
MRTTSIIFGALLGMVGTLGLALLLASVPPTKARSEEKTATHFEVLERKTPPKPKAPTPKPKPRKQTAPPPPSNLLGASLSGLSFGIEGLEEILSQSGDDLLNSTSAVVMTTDTVDVPPRPVQRESADYPSRARAKGLEGYVTMSILVDASGSVQDIMVVEAEPVNTFDGAAVSAVQNWVFAPGEYEGEPVSVRVTQTLRFVLGG